MNGKIVIMMLSCFVSSEIMSMNNDKEYAKKRQIIDKKYANKLKKYTTSAPKDHYIREIVKLKEKFKRYESDLYKKETDALDTFKTDHSIDDESWNECLNTIRGLKTFHASNVRNSFVSRKNDKGIPAKLRAMISDELEKKGIGSDYIQLQNDKRVTDITVVRSMMKFIEYEPYLIPSPGILKINPKAFISLSPECKKGLCISAVTLADPQVSVVYNVLQVFLPAVDSNIEQEEISALGNIYMRTAVQRCALRDQETAIALKEAYDRFFMTETEGFKFVSKVAMIWQKIAYNEALKTESMNDID